LFRGNVWFGAANIREFDFPDQFEGRGVLGKQAGAWRNAPDHYKCGKPDEIPAMQAHCSPPAFQKSAESH
jgi:hypothetical protein